jgi:hypothetical protein
VSREALDEPLPVGELPLGTRRTAHVGAATRTAPQPPGNSRDAAVLAITLARARLATQLLAVFSPVLTCLENLVPEAAP